MGRRGKRNLGKGEDKEAKRQGYDYQKIGKMFERMVIIHRAASFALGIFWRWFRKVSAAEAARCTL